MGPSLCGQRGSTVSEPSPDSLICTDRSVDHSPTEKHYEAVVLALGGGTVMTPECAELVHEKTLCVYLRASLETLVRNLEGEAEGRPMLASGEPLDVRIAALMALRSDTYEKTSHVIIDTDGKSIEEIASEIIDSQKQI